MLLQSPSAGRAEDAPCPVPFPPPRALKVVSKPPVLGIATPPLLLEHQVVPRQQPHGVPPAAGDKNIELTLT